MKVTLPNQLFSMFGQYLTELNRLSMATHRSQHPDHPLWQPQSYGLSETASQPCAPQLANTAVLHKDFQGSERSLGLHQIAKLKSLATLLRYAYVSDVDFSLVEFSGDDLVGRTATGRALVLSSSARPADQTVLFQSGDPDHWFCMARWLSLSAPGDSLGSRRSLSRPIQFLPNHTRLLRSLGARRCHSHLWAPPPGSANDDMAAFVNRHCPWPDDPDLHRRH